MFNPCHELTNELDVCVTSGKAAHNHCRRFNYDKTKIFKLENHRGKIIEKSSKNESIFFYPYALINQTWVMEENNHSITDPDIECGLLIFRHNNKYNEQRPFITSGTIHRDVTGRIHNMTDPNHKSWRNHKSYNGSRLNHTRLYSHHCNEDSCLTHLKAIRLYTPITDLTEWRKRTEYYQGRKAGGVTCRLLRIFGASILFPIFLNLTFSIVLFVNDFRHEWANIFEVIPLMLLCYPQYKVIKFLTRFLFIHRDENILNKDKEEHDRTIAPLEPFLESCLQVRN